MISYARSHRFLVNAGGDYSHSQGCEIDDPHDPCRDHLLCRDRFPCHGRSRDYGCSRDHDHVLCRAHHVYHHHDLDLFLDRDFDCYRVSYPGRRIGHTMANGVLHGRKMVTDGEGDSGRDLHRRRLHHRKVLVEGLHDHASIAQPARECRSNLSRSWRPQHPWRPVGQRKSRKQNLGACGLPKHHQSSRTVRKHLRDPDAQQIHSSFQHKLVHLIRTSCLT
mmetsp:Transcript_46838/g.63746  ORF Transcript_46838/g.63746 Transcript_46838/m.63746 type:complete len:221 (-) Transcript_46838:28-690(-)